GEEEVDLLRRAELKGRGVLEKKRPLFREEEIEARKVHLLLIGLDLREIGIDGEVGGQIRLNSPFHVEPDLTGPIELVGRGCVILVRRAEDERNELQIAPARQIDAGELRRQRDAVDVEAARNRREVDLLVLAADVPHYVEAPGTARA